MNPTELGTWIGDWAWGLPLIVLTVVIHVCGLALIRERVLDVLNAPADHHSFMLKFAVVMSLTSLLVTLLLGIEAAIWATAYRVLSALPNNRSAMLYSLNAITSYGHENLFLKDEWQLMGALEALNGMLLFGLSTAFLFAIIHRVWPVGGGQRNP
jgi:hypothetical protein